jgi:LuxR family maltose regulon positive regulatory protein
VLGRGGSQQLLESVERANLFLLPLDGERRWWRYHHLFADLLRARLPREDPARPPALHRAAADWYERHGLSDDAIGHALAAGDGDRAADLVEENLEEQIWRRNESATLGRWLTDLPVEVVSRRPRLLLGQAIVAVLGGRLDEAEPLLELAERAVPAAADAPPYRPSVDRRASILTNIAACTALCRADLARARGDPGREVAFTRAALALAGEADDLLRAMARYHLAETDWLAGRLGDAEREMAAILAEWAYSDAWLVLLRVGFDLGAVRQAQGRLGAALRTYRGLEARADPAAATLAGISLVGIASVLYERDELAEAAEKAAAGVQRCRKLAYAPPLVAGLLVSARIRLAQGDRAGALAALDEAEAVLPQAGDLRLPLRTRRAELALALGDVAAAADWVRARGCAVDDDPVYTREGEYLVLARVLIAQSDPGATVRMLRRWRALALAQDRIGSVIAVQTLAALALTACGEEPAAAAALAEALALAAPEGYLRVFVDERAGLVGLLRTLLVGRRLELAGTEAGRTVPHAFVARLAAAFDRAGTPVLPPARGGAVAVPGLVEPLSTREQEVLARLADGRPNRAIAEELFIGVDTVKRHVSHIFAKLGVTNRTQAVARARELGLLT